MASTKISNLLTKKAFEIPQHATDKSNLSDSQVKTFVTKELNGLLKDTVHKDILNKRFNIHFVKNKKFKENLQDQISILYHYWSSFGVGEKMAIAMKLAEGAKNCTDGLYERCFELTTNLCNTFSIERVLYRLRLELITNCARNIDTDVHHVNNFYRVAAKHYGVHGAPSKYRSRLEDQKIQQLLQDTISANYTPIDIIYEASEQLFTHLKQHYQYSGAKKPCNGDSYKYDAITNWVKVINATLEKKYDFSNEFKHHNATNDILTTLQQTLETNNKIINNIETSDQEALKHNNKNRIIRLEMMDILEQTTNKKIKLEQMDIRLSDEEDNILGLDHTMVNYEVYKYLKAGYFNLTPQTPLNELLDYCLNPAQKPDSNSEILAKSAKSIRNEPQRLKLLELTTNEEKKRQLLFAFLRTCESKKQCCDFLISVAKQNPEIIKLLFANLEKLEQEQYETFTKVINNNGDIPNVMMLAASCKIGDISSLLTLLKTKLSPEKFNALLTKTHKASSSNALMMAIKHNPLAVPELLKVINKLPPDDKFQILSQATNNGNNALMLALAFNSGSIKEIFETIKQLPQKHIEFILKQKGVRGRNVIHLAAKYHPEMLQLILKLVDSNKAYTTMKKELIREQDLNDNGCLAYATKFHSDALKYLLKSIHKVPSASFKQEMLLQLNKQGTNALMLAAIYQPGAIKLLLNAMTKKNVDQKNIAKILEQKSNHGKNALLIAVCHQPTAAIELIAYIKNTSHAKKVFNSQDKKSWSALMLAAVYQPQVIKPLLDAIFKTMKKENAIKLLTNTNKDGMNALMLAARYQPKAIKPLLDGIFTSVKKENVIKLLTKTNDEGMNTLMLAATYQPQAIKPLLNEMDSKDIKEMLKQKSNHGKNALSMAACQQPTATIELINYIENTSYAKEILNSQDDQNWDALMLAATYQPQTIEPLINAIFNSMKEENAITLLTKTNEKGMNALMLAATYQPQAIKPLLDAIFNSMKKENVIKLLNKTNEKGMSALMLAAIYQPKKALKPLLTHVSSLEQLNNTLANIQNSKMNQNARKKIYKKAFELQHSNSEQRKEMKKWDIEVFKQAHQAELKKSSPILFLLSEYGLWRSKMCNKIKKSRNISKLDVLRHAVKNKQSTTATVLARYTEAVNKP